MEFHSTNAEVVKQTNWDLKTEPSGKINNPRQKHENNMTVKQLTAEFSNSILSFHLILGCKKQLHSS